MSDQDGTKSRSWLPPVLALVGAVVVFGDLLWVFHSIPGISLVEPVVVREYVYPVLVLVGAVLLWRGGSVTRSWVSGGLIAMGALKIGETLVNFWNEWIGLRGADFGGEFWGQFAELLIGVSMTVAWTSPVEASTCSYTRPVESATSTSRLNGTPSKAG